MQIDEKYLEQAFKYLKNLPEGSINAVNDIAPNKPDLFIECVKKYIDCFHDVDFNSDYSKIRKLVTLL